MPEQVELYVGSTVGKVTLVGQIRFDPFGLVAMTEDHSTQIQTFLLTDVKYLMTAPGCRPFLRTV